MKKIKIILLMLVVILFSGCTVNYDLYINNDLSVNETVTASDGVKTFKLRTRQDPQVAANSFFEMYKNENNEYSFSTIEEDDIIKSTASTSFDSLEDYEKYFKTDIIEKVNITQKNNEITLEYNQNTQLSDNSSKSLIYDNIKVSIYVPFKVTYHNADLVEGNTYIWNIEKDGKLKNIKIDENDNQAYMSRE